MSVRISTTHTWSKLFVPISWLSRITAIVIVIGLLEAILPDSGVASVIMIVAFFGTLVLHGVYVEQWYHVVQTYLYVRTNLRTRISFHEAKHLLLLFAPTDEGVWYPMTGIPDLPEEYRRRVLFDSARKIYADRGYEFGIDTAGCDSARNGTTGADEINPAHDMDQALPGFRFLVAMVCKVAKSDGVITKDEIYVIAEFFTKVLELSTEVKDKAIAIFKQAKDSDTPFEVHAREFYRCHKDNKDLLEAAFDLLARVAFADGKLSAEEEVLLNQAIAIFDVEATEYFRAKAAYEDPATTAKSDEKEVYYARILGLDGAITPEAVKAAYRRLAVQYHPDKVSHLGAKIREVAEAEMKKINEAYAFFSQEHQGTRAKT